MANVHIPGYMQMDANERTTHNLRRTNVKHYSEAKAQQESRGWGDESGMRAGAICRADITCRSAATGLRPGDRVAVEKWNGSICMGYVEADSKMSVGGCYPVDGVRRVLSRPWRYETIHHPIHIVAGGCDYITMTTTEVCVFSDGTRIYRGNKGGTIVWLTGDGETQCDGPVTEAIARTPHA